MGLRRKGVVLVQAGATDFSYTVPNGRSIRVKDINLHLNAAGAEDYKVLVDRKLIFHFVAASGMYLLGQIQASGYRPIFKALQAAGVNLEIPVAAGQELWITQPGANNIFEVVYDEWDAGDQTEVMPNGSDARLYTLLQMISNSGVRATAGDLDLDQSDIDGSFPAFPGGESVPARTRMELVAMFGAPATHGTGAANGEYTTFLKGVKDREHILSEAMAGINFLGDVAHTANTCVYGAIFSRLDCGVVDTDPKVIAFPEPIIFEAGHEFNIAATIARTGAGGDFVADDIKLGLAFHVSRT